MKELYRTNDPTELSFASAILEGEGIKVFVLDSHMSVLEGQIGILPRRIMVADEKYEQARSILIDCDFNLKDDNT